MSAVAPLLAQLLNNTNDSIADTALIRDIKKSINQDLNKRYVTSVEKNKLYTSSDLDPRFKTLPLLTPDERQGTYARLAAEAVALQVNKHLNNNLFVMMHFYCLTTT